MLSVVSFSAEKPFECFSFKEKRNDMFIKLPVTVLHFGLAPNALKVYCAITACQNNDSRTAVVRMGKVAQHCNISRTTVASAVAQLEAAGLIERTNQYKQDGTYRSNKYTLAVIIGRWVAVPFSALQLPGSVFAVYVALRNCAGKGGRCFPSLSALSEILNLCRNTVIAAIKQLQAAGLVRKATQWFGKHNLYVLLQGQAGTKKECPARKRPSTLTNLLDRTSNNSILAVGGQKVNGRNFLFKNIFAFFSKWVVHFLYNKPIPTLNATKIRRKLTLMLLVRDKR